MASCYYKEESHFEEKQREREYVCVKERERDYWKMSHGLQGRCQVLSPRQECSRFNLHKKITKRKRVRKGAL